MDDSSPFSQRTPHFAAPTLASVLPRFDDDPQFSFRPNIFGRDLRRLPSANALTARLRQTHAHTKRLVQSRRVTSTGADFGTLPPPLEVHDIPRVPAGTLHLSHSTYAPRKKPPDYPVWISDPYDRPQQFAAIERCKHIAQMAHIGLVRVFTSAVHSVVPCTAGLLAQVPQLGHEHNPKSFPAVVTPRPFVASAQRVRSVARLVIARNPCRYFAPKMGVHIRFCHVNRSNRLHLLETLPPVCPIRAFTTSLLPLTSTSPRRHFSKSQSSKPLSHSRPTQPFFPSHAA